MGFRLKGFPGKGTFKRGVHPPERKNLSQDISIEVIPPPEKLLIPLLQNIGEACKAVIEPKQEVVFGEKIADADGFISAPLHAPLSGKIAKFAMTTLPNGRHVKAIQIDAHKEQVSEDALWHDMFFRDWPKDVYSLFSSEEISKRIRNAGIVGLGGAAFPTHVKIKYNQKKSIDALLVNGCECEPYLTTDYRVMVEAPEPVITGALFAAMATNAGQIVVCIEDNKPLAVKAISNAAKGTGIKVAVLKTKYPQGSERHMIKAVMNRVIPLGGLPGDVGVVVSNVATIAAVARAVLYEKPLTHRVVCVTGGGIKRPANLLVPLGMSYRALIDYCGGMTENAARILSGGPMMGFSFTDLDMPVTKGTSGITVLTHDEIKRDKETACLRCGRCVDVCPMALVPARLALAARKRDVEMAEKYNIMGCLETGCCGYVCPANIPLIQLIRAGKAMVMTNRKLQSKN
ncbi:MAG: electron transport complex subunit RsxC [Proteobacteria bacterium]|nr:electron transport complex subunit RsxC [Pseudomonadota bacterium]